MKNQTAGWKGVMLACGLLFLIFMAGCPSFTQQAPPASPTAPAPSPPAPTPSPTPPAANNTPAPPPAPVCSDKGCFIAAANDCKDLSLTLTEDVGVLNYTSSTGCVFTKALVSLNADETQEMKNLLQGKSMTCKYEKGKFDARLVTTLIYGMEYCEGDLKDILGQLIVFA